MRRSRRMIALAACVLTSANLGGAASATGVRAAVSPQVHGPNGIAAGPDGNMWFTEGRGNRIGRITPAGVITEFSGGLSRASSPEMITAGPDGNMWVTEEFGNHIGRITPAGVVSEFPATARILAVRQVEIRSVVVRLRCPPGAARRCRGMLRLGTTDPAVARRFAPWAAGRSTWVVIPITASASVACGEPGPDRHLVAAAGAA